MTDRSSLSDAFDRVESALQRVPFNPSWIAADGEPAMEALAAARKAYGECVARATFLDSMLRDAAEYLCDEVPHDALCGCTKPGDDGTCLLSIWRSKGGGA